MPAMPSEAWWLAIVVFLILGVAAVRDAFTGRVPDPLVFFGLLLTVAAQGFLVSWPFASRRLTLGLLALFAIWLVNQLWYRMKKRDALGMGDAKWTLLAVSCFGPEIGAFAWLLGAWLALFWMGALRVLKRPIAHVHFAPFLFVALTAGIYWLRLR